jgi:hypothetical protein
MLAIAISLFLATVGFIPVSLPVSIVQVGLTAGDQ